MIKVVAPRQHEIDGCAWYRGTGPLAAMARAGKIDLHFTGDHAWCDLKRADVLFLQRPGHTKHVEAVSQAKAMGTRVWVDYDDDLFNIPPENLCADLYGQTSVRNNMESVLLQADLVTVSTTHLGRMLETRCPNAKVVVVPNAVDESLIKMRDYQRTPQPIVLWRGTNTHVRDLMQVQDQILEVAGKFPKLKFMFMGYNPWFITGKLGAQAIILPPVDIFKYHQIISQLRPRFAICPLADNIFNRSKSNIAALEGGFASARVLAPDWEEWRLPGVANYREPEKFGYHLTKMLEGGGDADGHILWGHIEKNFLLENANTKRLNALEELLG